MPPRTAAKRPQSQAQEDLRILPRNRRTRPLLLLVDGYGLVFRSYFVLAAMGRPMHAPDGTPTAALYAFTTMLLNAFEKFDPDKVMVALDAHGPVFRNDLYDAYKANRSETPDDLKVQLEVLREYLTGSQLPWLEKAGFEADDLIGTFATRAAAAGMEVAIITGDKDTFQLVSNDITVFITKEGTKSMDRYDPAAVRERFGVDPAHFVDYKALLGDTSDNIPGVKGIGDVTAQKLLAQYPTIEELLAHLDEIKPEGVRKKLTESAEDAILSKKLSAIICDCDIEFDVTAQPDFRFEPANFAEWFGRFGFRTLSQRYGVIHAPTPPAIAAAPELTLPETLSKDEQKVVDVAVEAAIRTSEPVDIEIVQDMDRVKTLIAEIRNKGEFTVDFETTSLNPRDAKFVGIAISLDGRSGAYIPVGHHRDEGLLTMGPREGDCDNLPHDEVIALLRPIFEDPKIRKVVQNGKYEYAILENHGIKLAGLAFDTFVASYLLDPDQRHGLKDMAVRHLELVWHKIEDLIGTGKNQKSMDQVGIEDCASYAAHDAVATQRLQALFEPRLKEAKLESLFHDVEVPLVPILAQMENRGIRVDPKVLAEIDADLARQIGELEQRTSEITGGKSLNLNSPKQLAQYLFIDERLPDIKKGSTDVEVLYELKGTHDIIDVIIEHREVAKLRGTYTQGLLQLIERDGRIHTSYNQGVAATGRLSSQNPNLQNIPIRTEQGRKIRKAFIPTDDNHVLISADYSQIELRLLAHYTEDPALLEVFRSGGDIHTQTAIEVLGMDPANPDAEKRRRAKVINFGIIYGMGAFSLAKTLEISQSEAKLYIDNYFARFPGVQTFFDQVIQQGKTTGHVLTFLGRRRFFPDLNLGKGMRYEMAKRAAMNMPLQGGASDLIKMAMVEVAPLLQPLGTNMLLQVHDELVFEAPKARLEEAIECIGRTMVDTYQFKVPIAVDLKTGPSWYDMTPMKTFTSR